MPRRGPLDDPSVTPELLDRFLEVALDVLPLRPLALWSPSLFRVEVPSFRAAGRLQLHHDADVIQLLFHTSDEGFRRWNDIDDEHDTDPLLWITWETRTACDIPWRREVIRRFGVGRTRWTPQARGRGGGVRARDLELAIAVLSAWMAWKDGHRRDQEVEAGGKNVLVRLRPARSKRLMSPLRVPGPELEDGAVPLALDFQDHLLRIGKHDDLVYFANDFAEAVARHPASPELFERLVDRFRVEWRHVDDYRARNPGPAGDRRPPVTSLPPEIGVELARWLGATRRVPARTARACAAAAARVALVARARSAPAANGRPQ